MAYLMAPEPQDSVALARLLHDLAPQGHWSLVLAHCNHRLRPDSNHNAAYVEVMAARWGLPYCCRTADVPLASEEAARDWRYGMLAEMAVEHGCTAVVTGHTATDRAETLLLNLLRGSGADGLQVSGRGDVRKEKGQWMLELGRVKQPSALDISAALSCMSQKFTGIYCFGFFACRASLYTIWCHAHAVQHMLFTMLKTHMQKILCALPSNLIIGVAASTQALHWQRELVPGVRLVRPLLGVSRGETLQLCERVSVLVCWCFCAVYIVQCARGAC